MISFFDKENDEGNIEYKLYIKQKKSKEKLLSQCFYRLREGNGKAIYFIGVADNGSLKIQKLENLLGSLLTFINIIKPYCIYKTKLFTYKSYVYAIVTIINTDINTINDLVDFNEL